MKLEMTKDFASMSRIELLDYCRKLYAEKGVAAFTYPALKSIPKLYYNLYSKELSQKKLLKELGIDQEYKQHVLSKPIKYGKTLRERWTWDSILQKALTIKEVEGRLPPAMWFQKNGHSSFIQSLYDLGRTWADLREAVDDFSGSNFVQSRNGMRWLSHAEASLSNFLYARGIEHKKGERYDESFVYLDAGRYAIFDMHFLGKNGEWFDVEIWGDKPNGHNEEKYAKTRSAKEFFNSSNPHFLGIHFGDCYDEAKLAGILSPHIGHIAPFQFDKPTDSLIHSTHWSNADELLEFCRHLVTTMPDGQFPTEEWLRKRGKWKNRPGEVYNTLSVYIKTWLGGVRNLRKLLGQPNVSTIEWDKNSAIAAYQKFYDEHGLTPGQARHIGKKGGNVSSEQAAEAARIDNAVLKYAGGAATVNELLGIVIDRTRGWSREAILDGFQAIISKWSISPTQLLYDHKAGKTELPPETYQNICQLLDAVGRKFEGVKEVYEILGFEPPSRPRQRRTKIKSKSHS